MFIDNEFNEDNVLCCRVPVNVRDNADFLYSEEHKDIYPVVLRFVQFVIAKRGWFFRVLYNTSKICTNTGYGEFKVFIEIQRLPRNNIPYAIC